ncbi:MAG: homoserine O-acetyltransferase [Rhodospirillaceae bacterium]|jgi:homoserine O-acetyltransferase/O-succinyltransferase|nr:homoserine O-acetyltransferase [Rhodospirillaceae bacterium]MBT6403381.1 homoserine O-acetyltransferase [Rhodospirillaceae bacterium]MBT6537840.1 homoserine O-acetyltransferase [Rhodospirillaceae bacterium]MBT7360475.1 homoserine O-acetyltransferase [Rhodospirillaceae bacterium]
MNTIRDIARFDQPLTLDSGAVLPHIDVAYETYGELNAEADNAVLVLHGLTGTQHAMGTSPETGRPGWWDAAIGPGKAIDTDRYFVVSPNALGSYGGSTSAASPDPETNLPYGSRFPIVTIGDSVESHARLADKLGITRFHSIIGGCFGGFQAMEWMARHPDMVGSSVVISATPRTSAHNTALWSVLRAAIRSDPNWNGGNYYNRDAPDTGLGLAAMFGALFWMSREVFETKFGLRRIEGDEPQYGFEPEYAVEEFLEGVSRNAAGRIDANALLYLTRAIDYFDMRRGHADLAAAFARYAAPTLLISYTGDWRYPAEDMEEIAVALRENSTGCRHDTLNSPAGHGGFLYDTERLSPLLAAFLNDPKTVVQAS